jgi:hypothetical protein
VYVDATTATSGSGIALKANGTEFAYAYAVGQDGTLSEGFIGAVLGTAVTTDIGAADSAYTKSAKDIALTPNKNSLDVTWTQADDFTYDQGTTGDSDGDLKFTVKGYRVTATLANGVSLVQYVAKTASSATFSGLNWSGKYTIAVDTIVEQKTFSTDWSAAVDKIVVAATNNADKKEITIAKLPTIAKPVAATTPVTANNTGISATVNWTGIDGTSYLVEVLDVNKAVLETKTVTLAGSTSGSHSLTTALTPGAKYTVNVYTLGDVPGTKSAALAINVTVAAYPGATVKAASSAKPTITTVSLVVTAPDTSKFPAGAGNYYIEYTNVADAKGKPDWNAAKFYGTTTPTLVTAGVNPITIEKLDPNSQYFFRVVTAGTAYDGTHAWKGSGQTGQTKIVASKEIKVKTAAVPLPTITKPSLALTSDNDLTLNFTGKSLEQVIAPLAGGTKAVSLGGNAKIIYSVLVSASSTVDKATGKLLAAELVTVADNGGFVDGGENGIATNSDNNYKADNIKLTDAGLTALVLTGSTKLFDQLGNASSLKALNIQLVATINSDLTADDGAVVYSKVAKITLPKWFV